MDDDAEIIAEFLVESHENLDQLDRDLVELERQPGSRDLLSSIFRTIHTIKGTSGFLALHRLEALTHVGENLLSRLRDGEMTMTPDTTGVLLRMVDTVRALLDVVERTATDVGDDPDDIDVDGVVADLRDVLEGRAPAAAAAPTPAPDRVPEPAPEPAPEPHPVAQAEPAPYDETPTDPAEGQRRAVDATVRVDVDLLDNLVQLVGELVLTRNQILQKTDAHADVELGRAAQRLDLVASELQENVMKTRMQPIGQVWAKLPRVVRDLAHQLGREVELEMEGHDTELDRSLLEALKDPLTHLVRNALDHGIEPPETRLARGKERVGRLRLKAYHESGQVVVEITDDGAGIDPRRIGDVAVARGVVTREAAARLDGRDLLDLIFRPGFSTAAAVTNVSGRGVGMDVVRTNIERIGGTVDLASEPGIGTTFRVRIPLTLAIIPALVVGEGGERYAIPQANLVELVRIEARDLEVLAGAPVMRLRGRLLPLVSLAEVLGSPDAEPAEETDARLVVVLQADDVRFGLCVGDIHDTQEIVVKPIGRQLKAMAMYAGATIMGDGRVALILDVMGLARSRGIDQTVQLAVEQRAVVEERVTLLVVQVAGDRRAALPLTDVARLEEFPSAVLEHAGTTEVVQYRDGILPLVRLAALVGLPSGPPAEQVAVVVHETPDGQRVGIVIDRVLDIVETTATRTDVGRRPGVLGSTVVDGHVTELVDTDAVVARALPGRAELAGVR
ncbi:MAG TPA: chemotaxis protein CheW [Nocardioides sp.]